MGVASSRTDLDYYPNPMTNMASVPVVPPRMYGAAAEKFGWRPRNAMVAKRYLDHKAAWGWMDRPIIEKTNAGAMYHHTRVEGQPDPRVRGIENEHG